MARCEWCGKEFDIDEAREIFDDECGRIWSYDNFGKCLCGECAVEAIQDEADGVYFETCECCGKNFDYGEECRIFYDNANASFGLADCWSNRILCASCAIDEIDEENAMYGDNSDGDDDDNEGIDVYTAADIWLSHGKDEDYMFGYSEDELEEALNE